RFPRRRKLREVNVSGKALGLAPARHDEATTLLYRLGFRGWSTLLKLAAVIALEVVIVFGYVGHGAIDHYALHPMIAMASALPLFLLVRTLGFRLRAADILFLLELRPLSRLLV